MKQDNHREIVVLKNKNEFISYIAEKFIDLVISVQKEKEIFSVIMGGGKTPIEFNKYIVDLGKDYKIDWDKVLIFFTDERCVPPEDKESNYKMILDTLINPLGINYNNVFRILGEKGNIYASKEYHETLCRFAEKNKNQIPKFDLALLGVGKDGHTASLFPNRHSLKTYDKFAVAGGIGPNGLERITVTYPVLNFSKNIWVVVNGEEKGKVIKQIIYGNNDLIKLPIKGINPINGKMIYILDDEAGQVVYKDIRKEGCEK